MFWAEALHTTRYTINRSPSIVLQFKTPQERQNGKAADYRVLKVFGCMTYMHVKGYKLDARAMKCMFSGYPNGVNGYKLQDFENRKCVISKDIVFREYEMFMPNKLAIDFGVVPTGNEENVTKMEVEHESQIDIEMGSTQDMSEELNDYQLARDRERRPH